MTSAPSIPGSPLVSFCTPAEAAFANLIIAACHLHGADVVTALRVAALGIEGARIERNKAAGSPAELAASPLENSHGQRKKETPHRSQPRSAG
jgi:hypothetical protein